MRLVLPLLVATLSSACAQETTPVVTTVDPRAIDSRVLCPSPQPCKVLILTSEEETVLTSTVTLQDGNRTIPGILTTAEQGRPLDLTGIVRYFRDKIHNAPHGTNAPPTPPAQK